MKKQEKQKDLRLIKDIAQELGLSPLDIFMHWVAKGEIQKVTVNIAYKNGDVIEANITDLCYASDLAVPSKTDVQVQEEAKTDAQVQVQEETKPDVQSQDDAKTDAQAQEEKVSAPAPNADKEVVIPDKQKPTPQLLPPNKIVQDVSDSDTSVTSIKRGTICLKTGQTNNIRIGSFVYSTGDILSKYKALGPVQIKGIVLSYSEKCITIIRYIGNDLTALDSVAQIKDDWRFLNYHECRKMIRYQDALNSSLADMRVKQIKDPALLLYKETNNQLHVFDVASQEVRATLDDKTIGVSRTFTVYLAKDLKIV